MRMSRLFGRTLREAPSEAETASHRLLLRAGYIDQLMAGVYSYLPLGWRVKRRVEQIVREEMDAAGAQELHMPAIQPVELWRRSGREDAMGPVLFHLHDQRERELVLAPTHEELITSLFTAHASSYRDLPVTLYQIQNKFRDEARPRNGLIRVREFTMKDAYSFDLDDEGAIASYRTMRDAYRRIFARCGVPTVPVQADSGAIGGKESEEFVFLTDTGEDTIVLCDSCGYAANTEKAEFIRPPLPDSPEAPIEVVDTPGTTTIEALAALLGVSPADTAKAVFIVATDPAGEQPPLPVFAVVRGDLQVNEVKLRNVIGGSRDLRAMTDEEIAAYGLVAGYASPVGLVDDRILVIADTSIPGSPNLVAGANEPGKHLRNVTYGRDWSAARVADIATAEAGHSCPRCGDADGSGGTLGLRRGIEMGHVFRLGRLYSETFEARVLDAEGQQRVPVMGCYGIGVDRIVAAAVEAHHDEAGMAWPASIAPFDVHLVGLGLHRDAELSAAAEELYGELRMAGLEVLYDDRDESAGVKFNDADLIGIPLRMTVSPRNHRAGVVEIVQRTAATPAEPEQIERDTAVYKARELQGEARAALDPEV